MRKITQNVMFVLLLLMASLCYSQKVAIIGMNHVGTDGFSFVVTQDLSNGEVIYFTENEYDNAANVFTDQTEAVVTFTATSAILKGNVVFVKETSTDTFTVTCTSGSGTAVKTVASSNFALGTDGETFYAYTDSDSNPTNGITTIYSAMYTGNSEGPVNSNGGPIPAAQNPVPDFPNAIVVQNFPAAQPNRVEFKTTALDRTNVNKVMLENPNNYVHAQTNADLSLQFFTNLNLASANPTLTVSASPSSVNENSGTGMVYTFTLSANAASNITVNFTVGGTAVFGTDYTRTGGATFTATSGTIVIPSGSNSASLTLTPVAESSLEPHETIVITLAAGTGYDAGSPGSATTTILNDDTTNNEPMFALVGSSHADPDGFSFVATKDIPANTVVYFTDNSFSTSTLTFTPGEAVVRWTSPGTTFTKGNVVVVTETAPDVLSATCSGGSCGTIALISGNFALATTGETLYAYADNDTDPSNGVTEVYAVLFTGTSTTSGGNIPAIEDPSSIFLRALVVDGFPTTPSPARTEYNPAGRNILVTEAIFENPSNWVYGQTPPALSTTPFTNLNVLDSTPPTAVCQNISVTPNIGTGSVTISASQIDNGSTDNVGIASMSVSPNTFTCANIGTPVTVTLTVNDAAGNSATCTATVTVLPNAVATFTQVNPICEGGSFTLPTTSNNGTTGTWAPAINNTQTTTYTFTPNAGQCASATTMTVVVNPNVTPTFNQVAAICSGGSFSLPTTSTNSITGTWSPAINNTQTTTYTFTPGIGQCATTTTMTVVVNPNITPTFTQVAAICSGGSFTLPTTSNNGITGTWAPAIDNTQTTTYTFTPDAGQCATTASMTVTVNPNVTPAFTQVAAICSGGSFSLPTTSNNGVTGTWAPAIDNTATTTYTFTPDAGQCATTATMTVTVNPIVTPSFTQVAAVCSGGSFSLPTTSNNGITGAWSPAIDNTQTTTYTFTPDSGQCATNATMTVTVNPIVTPSFTQVADICSGGSFSLPTTSDNGITGTWAPAIDNTQTTTYTFTPDAGQCAVTATMTVTVNPATSNTTTITACGSYQWAVTGLTYSASGNYTQTTGCHSEILALTINPLPAGYNAASAINVTSLPYTAAGNNLASNCHINNGGGSQAPDTWYKVMIDPCAVTVSANTCAGASYDTWLTAYAQDGTTVLASNDDACGLRSSITFNRGNNAFIYIVVDGYNGGQGTYTLNVSQNIPTSATFPAFAPICAGSTIAPLPTVSNEGVVGTWSPALDNTQTTTYTFTPTNTSCGIAPVQATIQVTNPVGNPATFGSDVWNVYAFNAGGTEDTGSSWNTNYSGYYTIPTLSFDTTAQWCNGCSPSDAPGYQGCAVSADNHSWSAKRRGFPAGVYSIDIPSHDDEAELWVNGVMVWEHVGCCDSHSAVWQGNLGAFDTVEYRVTEGVGGSHGVITFNVLPSPPASLTATYCGATINNTAVTLVSNYVQGAQAYRFRVRNGVSGAVVGIVDRPVNSFALSNMPGITLGTSYVIDVAIRVNNAWQPFYGLPCTVTTPTPLATIGTYCGTTVSSMSQWVYANYQPSVTAYRFRLTNHTTSAVVVYDALNGLNKFNFNQLPASFRMPATTYTVEVALRNTDGTYLPYGAPCNIFTPGLTKTAVATSVAFKALVYPNPYAENFMFDVKTTDESAVQVRVYDMLGKQIENTSIEAADINSVQFGERYPSGVYNVIVSQGENTQTLRVIKR